MNLLSLFSRPNPGIFRRIPLPVNGKLHVSPMPFGAYDRGNSLIGIYRNLGIEHAIMVLTTDEIVRKGRKNLRGEYERAGISYSQYQVRDFQAPSLELIAELVTNAAERLERGEKIAVHCHAGVGRTAVAACCIVARVAKLEVEQAIAHVREHMPVNMTPEQISAIGRFVTTHL